jgi:hypothetical protein
VLRASIHAALRCWREAKALLHPEPGTGFFSRTAGVDKESRRKQNDLINGPFLNREGVAQSVEQRTFNRL